VDLDQASRRLANLMLVAADIDMEVFGQHVIAEGFGRYFEYLTVYEIDSWPKTSMGYREGLRRLPCMYHE
jgi:hypothetical protein